MGVIRYIINKTHSKKDYPEEFNLNGVHESNMIIIAHNFKYFYFHKNWRRTSI